MKIILTFLTIALFSFGASAEYNKKFTAEKCKVLYVMSDTLNTTFMSLFNKYGIENGGNFVGQQGEVLGEGIKMIASLSNAYQTFCKD